MRIVLVTGNFAPHFEGGTEAVARAQARELARRGHDVSILSGTDRPHTGEDREFAEVDGLSVSFFPRTAAEPYDLTLERPRIEALVCEAAASADVVHLHHWASLSGSLVRLLSRSAPVVVTLHDSFTSCPRFFRVPAAPVTACPERGDFEPCVRCIESDAGDAPREALAAGLHARSLAFQAELDAAARILVPSASHGNRLGQFVELPPERLSVLHHGLAGPLEELDVALPWRPEEGERLRVVTFGHRTQVKGTSDLVRALAALDPAKRARVELVSLGSEVEEGFDAALRSLAGELSLRLEAPYDLADLPRRLSALGGAHLAAFPSRVHESYALVLDEAHALGLPAWVSDRGAPMERVAGGGRVLPAEDAAAWTRAFDDLFTNPKALDDERASVPSTPRTAADAARELESLYRELISTP